MSDVDRYQTGLIDQRLNEFPAVILIGARQVGKTSLAKTARPDWRYFDLEKPSDFDLITRDMEFFFEGHPGSTILDEVQESPELFKTLRGVIDQKRKSTNRFLLTGSSSPLLIERVSESLAGRVAIIEVGTLKASESLELPLSPFYKAFKKKISLKSWDSVQPQINSKEMQERWFRGGYPEPVLAKKPHFWATWMENYFLTYLNRDVRKLFPRLDIVRFRRFLTILAKISGQAVNKSQIAGAVEISEPVVRDYIDIAEGTFLWRKLQSFEASGEKVLTKSPKGHLRDSGLLHYLLRLENIEDLRSDPIAGFSFESFVIEEILKGLSAQGVQNWNASFYRTRNRAEIDLVLEGSFGVLPIEIKLGKETPLKKLGALKSFIEDHEAPIGLVINCSEKPDWLAPKILQVPVGCL